MLLNEKTQKRNRMLLFAAIGIFFAATWVMFLYLSAIQDGKWFDCRDLKGHRAFVGYALNGKDPYLYIGKDALNEFIGKIPPRFSNVPWALIFGAFFYPGYMPLTAAKIYLTALHFVFLGFGLYLICKKTGNKKNIFIIAFCAVSHFSFMYSIYWGNCGGVVSLMLICALLLAEDKPVISGILMGFALLKPQISAIFCLVWLIDKKIIPLITAGVICVAGWAASSAATGVNPLTLLKEMSEASTASEEQYLGLLSPLRFFGVDSMIILAVNVVIGVAFTVILGMKLKKSGVSDKSVFLKYTPAAIASCFWIYKNGTDFLVLLIAVIALIEVLDFLDTKDFWISLICVAGLEMSRGAVSAVSSLSFTNLLLRDALKSAEGFALMIIGIIICSIITKAYKTKETV